MRQNEFDSEVLINGHGPAAEFLTSQGYRTSKSYLSKLCAPSVGEGPKTEGIYNGRPLFRPTTLLAWAQQRIKPAKPAPIAASIPDATPTIDASTTAPVRRKRGRPKKNPAPVVASPPTAPAEMLPPAGES